MKGMIILNKLTIWIISLKIWKWLIIKIILSFIKLKINKVKNYNN